MNGCESAEQREPGIFRGVDGGLGGLLFAVVGEFMIAVEVPIQMDVCVDPAGHYGEAAKVVRNGTALGSVDRANLRAFDDDILIFLDASLPVDERAHPEDGFLGAQVEEREGADCAQPDPDHVQTLAN